MKYILCIMSATFILLSCSRQSERELYAEGAAAYDQKNYQLAIERFQAVVERASGTAYAESSQYRIALLYNNDLHDVRKALSAYRKFYTLFPSSKEAPAALFLTGYLLNNELHMLDSAKAVYETFLQLYPGHELTRSARFEIASLGKDPAQLLVSPGSPPDEPAESKK